MPTRRTVLGTVALAGLAGCVSAAPPTAAPDGGDESMPVDGETVWYTHPRPTGNRHVDGAGPLHEADAVTFAPGGRPQWLVVHPGREGSHWTVVTADGRASHRVVADGSADRLSSAGDQPPETPPVVAAGDVGHRLLLPTRARDELAAVRRTRVGAETVRRHPLTGALSSNVTGVQFGAGRLAVGAGTGETVHVWQS
ncbi:MULTISPECIES: hypothetical protein [Haloarcula]|uniref:hypothetical protein n=1 Tax=Haloarcula TaxID=2237 RepID=UPI0023ED3E01|nr:hypothetical protein [Halomicroarcula sp. XH51]